MEGTKQCSICGVVKPLSSFALQHKKSRDGRHSQCKQCRNEHNKTKYKKNRLENQFRQLIKSSKVRAKTANLIHDIDVEYLRSIATEYCPYQNVKLRWAVDCSDEGFNTSSDTSPSLDRLDNSKGYVRGNVVIVSHRANAIKRDATEQELIEMGHRIARLKMQMAMPE